MDALLTERWRADLSPFAGDCLYTHDLVTVEGLRAVLAVTVPVLAAGRDTEPLYTFDDWHRHDGYVTERRVVDWGELKDLTRSADRLLRSRQGDTYVHRAYYPADLSFLLRYDVPDEESGDGCGFAGAFDLSADPPTTARVLALITPAWRSSLRIEPSKGYFDRTYAG